MNLTLKRTPGIYLVGFMGSGKSTVGRMLARRLGWHFVDIDQQIEEAEKMFITAIFDTRGEREFRRLEAEAIARVARAVARGRPSVIALGGGAFAQPGNAEVVSGHGVSIWLDVTLELAGERCRGASHRPLARDSVQFEKLYLARRDSYARANYRVPVEVNDSALVVDTIMKLPLFE